MFKTKILVFFLRFWKGSAKEERTKEKQDCQNRNQPRTSRFPTGRLLLQSRNLSKPLRTSSADGQPATCFQHSLFTDNSGSETVFRIVRKSTRIFANHPETGSALPVLPVCNDAPARLLEAGLFNSNTGSSSVCQFSTGFSV